MGAKSTNAVRNLRAGMVVVTAGMCVLFFGRFLVESSALFLLAGIYGALLYRVVVLSGRAFFVMGLTGVMLICHSLATVQQSSGIPAAGPWLLGFIAGGITGGYVWSGPRAGAEFRRKTQRRRRPDGGYPGGWQPALVNAVSVLLLLGLGTAHFLLQSPTLPVGAVLAGSVAAGWALFRFAKTQPGRFMFLLPVPLLYLLLIVVGSEIGQRALGLVFAYGIMAGFLIGGRYWTGPRLGEPRPPFAGQRPRRKRRSSPRRTSPAGPAKARDGSGHNLSATGVPAP